MCMDFRLNNGCHSDDFWVVKTQNKLLNKVLLDKFKKNLDRLTKKRVKSSLSSGGFRLQILSNSILIWRSRFTLVQN